MFSWIFGSQLSLDLWMPVKKVPTPATSKSALSAHTPAAHPIAARVCQVSLAMGKPVKVLQKKKKKAQEPLQKLPSVTSCTLRPVQSRSSGMLLLLFHI